LLMAQVFGQSLVVRAAKVSIQQAVQLDFQAPSATAKPCGETSPCW
jgi:hypothetical protein